MNRINENISTHLRRRLSFETLKGELDNILDYEINPCNFEPVGELVAEVCDMLVNNVLEDINSTFKDKDGLYFYFVDTFGDYIVKYYNKHCVKGLKESKKRIIVTESQYRRLFEQKKSKVEMFQDLINEKLEDIKNQCEDLNSDNFNVGFQSCDDVEIIDSIVVDDVEMMTGGRTDMYGDIHDVTSSIYIQLTINYSNIKNIEEFDDIIYDLKWMLKNSTGGLPIVFNYKTNNTNKNKEW